MLIAWASCAWARASALLHCLHLRHTGGHSRRTFGGGALLARHESAAAHGDRHSVGGWIAIGGGLNIAAAKEEFSSAGHFGHVGRISGGLKFDMGVTPGGIGVWVEFHCTPLGTLPSTIEKVHYIPRFDALRKILKEHLGRHTALLGITSLVLCALRGVSLQLHRIGLLLRLALTMPLAGHLTTLGLLVRLLRLALALLLVGLLDLALTLHLSLSLLLRVGILPYGRLCLPLALLLLVVLVKPLLV